MLQQNENIDGDSSSKNSNEALLDVDIQNGIALYKDLKSYSAAIDALLPAFNFYIDKLNYLTKGSTNNSQKDIIPQVQDIQKQIYVSGLYLGLCYLQLKKFEEAETYFSKTQKVAISLNNAASVTELNYYLGYLNYAQNNFIVAYNFYSKVIEYIKSIPPNSLIKTITAFSINETYHSLGLTCKRLQNEKESKEHFKQSLQYYDDPIARLRCVSELAFIEFNQKNYQFVINSFNENLNESSIEILRKNPNLDKKIHQVLGLSYSKENDFKNAIACLKKSFDNIKENPIETLINYVALGICYALENNKIAAETNLKVILPTLKNDAQFREKALPILVKLFPANLSAFDQSEISEIREIAGLVKKYLKNELVIKPPSDEMIRNLLTSWKDPPYNKEDSSIDNTLRCCQFCIDDNEEKTSLCIIMNGETADSTTEIRNKLNRIYTKNFPDFPHDIKFLQLNVVGRGHSKNSVPRLYIEGFEKEKLDYLCEDIERKILQNRYNLIYSILASNMKDLRSNYVQIFETYFKNLEKIRDEAKAYPVKQSSSEYTATFYPQSVLLENYKRSSGYPISNAKKTNEKKSTTKKKHLLLTHTVHFKEGKMEKSDSDESSADSDSYKKRKILSDKVEIRENTNTAGYKF